MARTVTCCTVCVLTSGVMCCLGLSRFLVVICVVTSSSEVGRCLVVACVESCCSRVGTGLVVTCYMTCVVTCCPGVGRCLGAG